MPLFLHLAARDDVLQPQIPDWAVALCIFFGANNMFKGKKCQLVSLSLPQAKQPHQLALNLKLCRYIDTNHHATTAAHLKRRNLLPALKRALQCGWQGKSMRLVWWPDLAARTKTLNAQPPTAKEWCAECHALRERFRDRMCPPAALRQFSTLETQYFDSFDLFTSPLNVVYNTLHCCALVLTNLVVHSL